MAVLTKGVIIFTYDITYDKLCDLRERKHNLNAHLHSIVVHQNKLADKDGDIPHNILLTVKRGGTATIVCFPKISKCFLPPQIIIRYYSHTFDNSIIVIEVYFSSL